MTKVVDSFNITIADIDIQVERKSVKNIHLSVYPPDGRVRVAAPSRMKADTIRVFVLSKLTWIRKQQDKMLTQVREEPREYIERESHYVWGERYLLKIAEKEEKPKVSISGKKIYLQVRPGSSYKKRQAVYEEWQREELRKRYTEYVANWMQKIGVKPEKLLIHKMKTRWGSCGQETKTIRVNLELIKKPPVCLEYIVVHELLHFIERKHNKHYYALMDHYYPNWKAVQDELKRLPLKVEKWAY